MNSIISAVSSFVTKTVDHFKKNPADAVLILITLMFIDIETDIDNIEDLKEFIGE